MRFFFAVLFACFLFLSLCVCDVMTLQTVCRAMCIDHDCVWMAVCDIQDNITMREFILATDLEGNTVRDWGSHGVRPGCFTHINSIAIAYHGHNHHNYSNRTVLVSDTTSFGYEAGAGFSRMGWFTLACLELGGVWRKTWI